MKKLAFLSLFLLPFSAFAQNDDCMTRTTVPDEKGSKNKDKNASFFI